MVVPYIENWDTGRVAREKINSIIDEVYASIPSIWENGHWYIWGVDTGINAVWFTLKETDNLIKETQNKEIYVDLQLDSYIQSTANFPVGVCVWNVREIDGREENGLLLNLKTKSLSYARVLYWDSGKLYFDKGNGIFKRIATTDYVDNALNNLRTELHRVAFTGLSSDLNNDAGFTADNVLTNDEYQQIWPTTESDDKRYFIYKTVRK